MLRYPVPVPTEPGKPMKQAWLIDWKNPLNNIFSVAEEVRVATTGGEVAHRRPDVCLYVNGILFGVIELKKATVSIEEGVRQNWRNQQDGEIPGFFSTAQLLVSGSESEGVKYGTTLTPPKSSPGNAFSKAALTAASSSILVRLFPPPGYYSINARHYFTVLVPVTRPIESRYVVLP